MIASLTCGRHTLALGSRPLLMGILNVTPDSFSDGGRYLEPRRALSHALRMQAEGADLIDVGAESTRPGARPVSLKEELSRLMPVLERLVPRLQVPISVDTAKAGVARRAVEAGASMINDVTALRDPRMPEVVARAHVPVILMHMRGTPRTMQHRATYRRLLPEIQQELRGALKRALSAGIPRRNILIDPGIGFSKDAQQNLLLLKRLSVFKRMGLPIVVGPSRKSFLGQVTGRAVGDRLFATAAAVAISVANGADVVRVHDVGAMRQVANLAWAIARAEE